MKEFYDEYLEKQLGTVQHPEKLRYIKHNYKRFFPKNKDAKLLDIGIGCCEMLTIFRRKGYYFYQGIDISPSTIAMGKKLGFNCTLVNSTEEFMAEHKNEFDLITLCDVIEHVPKENLIMFTKSILDGLKTNGTLIIQTCNAQSPEPGLARYNDVTHEGTFSEASLRQLLVISGTSETKIKFYPFEIIVKKGVISEVRKIIRESYYKYIHVRRMLIEDIHPDIMSPIFFAVVRNH